MIPNRNFMLAHQARNVYFVTVPKGMTPEDVEDGKAWSHLHYALKVNDMIEVVAEDGSFDGVVRVIARGDHGVSVRIVNMAIYADAGQPSADAGAFMAASVSWGGPAQKWRIVMPDGFVAARDFATKDEAEVRLASLRAG
jgi:hypothetical protein